MIGLLQRVSQAEVRVAGTCVGHIRRGLLVLVGVQQHDDPRAAERLAERILTYRVFADDAGKMNLSLLEVGGGLLLVPQFTLAADTRKGRRPSFSGAASSELGARLFDHLLQTAAARVDGVASGVFGADMQVALINDGPVTFWLES